MTRRKRSNPRDTTNKNKTRRPKKSEIRIVKDDQSPRERARRKRAKRERERIYKRRRIILLILALLIIIIPSVLIYKKLNAYANQILLVQLKSEQCW